MDDCSNISRLITKLETTDRFTREWRAHRWSYVRGLTQPGNTIFGGVIAEESIKEARQAYIDGLYMATILLSLAFVEHEITSRVKWTEIFDEDDKRLKERPNIGDVLEAGKKHDVLSEAEFKAFDNLGRVRNQYSHFRSYENRHSYEEKDVCRKEGEYKAQSSVVEGMEPHARKALETVESFLGRNSLLEEEADAD